MSITSIAQIKSISADAGSHFFDRETLAFFGSRILSSVFPDGNGGATFVTSETDPWGRDRRYTVRHIAPDARIETVGEFRAFDDRRNALRGARIAADNITASA